MHLPRKDSVTMPQTEFEALIKRAIEEEGKVERFEQLHEQWKSLRQRFRIRAHEKVEV